VTKLQPISGTKPLVEGALAAALAAILALVGLYIPILSSLATIVWTIPITLMVARYSLRDGLLAVIVTMVLVIILSNPLTAVLYVAQFGVVGLFYGLALKRQLSAGSSILGGVGISIISTVIITLASLQIMGITLSDLGQQLQSSVDSIVEFYRRAGVLEDYQAQGITEEALREAATQIVLFFQRILPGLLAVGAAITASLNYLIVQLVARRLQIPVVSLPPFREWQMPWYLTWGVVVAFAALLAGDYFGLSWLMIGGQNLLVLYAPFLIIFGIAVVSYYYQKSKLPRWFKASLIIFSCFYISITVVLIMSVGLFDPLFNYRKLGSKEGMRD
jgi:uncharacterized protein YybS (DUF2232 family)